MLFIIIQRAFVILLGENCTNANSTQHLDTWLIICSPVSGKRQGRRYVEEQLIPQLKARNIPFQISYTERFQHAKQLAKGQSRIICVGGDGTANEVLESCPVNSTIAIVSHGTMNFFGVCADLPSKASDLVDLIARKSSRPCSLMRVSTVSSPIKYHPNKTKTSEQLTKIFI